MKVTIDGIEYGPIPEVVVSKKPLHVLLKEIRRALGLTLDEACGIIGCARSTIQHLEDGRLPNPSLKMSAKIARAYGVPIHILAAAALNEE